MGIVISDIGASGNICSSSSSSICARLLIAFRHVKGCFLGDGLQVDDSFCFTRDFMALPLVGPKNIRLIGLLRFGGLSMFFDCPPSFWVLS